MLVLSVIFRWGII